MGWVMMSEPDLSRIVVFPQTELARFDPFRALQLGVVYFFFGDRLVEQRR